MTSFGFPPYNFFLLYIVQNCSGVYTTSHPVDKGVQCRRIIILPSSVEVWNHCKSHAWGHVVELGHRDNMTLLWMFGRLATKSLQENYLLYLSCLPVRLFACKAPETVDVFSLNSVDESFTKILWTHSDLGETRTTIPDALREDLIAFLHTCRAKLDKCCIGWSEKCLSQMQGELRCNVVCSLLRRYATSRKVADSIPDEVIGFFSWPNLSSRTMALRSTQPLTEMSTRNLPGW
jgi:hypothetical protein